jgi:citrate lyase subunit beta / citryl-CoA lyase
MTGPLLLRSMMFVPGHNRRLLESAARSDADALILDLEDSVRPDDQKQAARDTIRAVLGEGLLAGRTVFARVNDRESGHLLRDVLALTVEGITGFVYPKSRSGQDVYFFDKLLETVEAERGIPLGTFAVVPLIETTEAVLQALDICRASPRVVAIAFGCEDFVADLGGVHDEAGHSLYTARALIALAAKAAGVQAIDTVHIDVHDLAGLERNLRLARELGFDGMLVLHPKEIEVAHRWLSPSPEEVAGAREMVRLCQEAEKQNRGVAILDGRFIGPPMLLAARRTLARHELIARLARRPE